MNVLIVQEPKNETYGQRRFLTKDPNGCLIDICSPWEPEECIKLTGLQDVPEDSTAVC